MAPQIEDVDEFDDDTDIPLPSRPLPNTGTRGAILEEIGAPSGSDNEMDFGPTASGSGNASSTSRAFAKNPMQPNQQRFTGDKSAYKTWNTIYPVYLDAKKPYGSGRRVSRDHALWWPLSTDIANAASKMGLSVVHEVDKSHPRDWDNPGRVRVLWKQNGKLVNHQFTTKKKLLEGLGRAVQRIRPDLVPKEPFNFAKPVHADALPPQKSKSLKGKAPAHEPASKSSVTSSKPNGRTAQPPSVPDLAQRVSTYSPLVVSGMLLEAVKAGMQAQETNAPPAIPGAPAPGTPAAMGKGKRKVVRVRQ